MIGNDNEAKLGIMIRLSSAMRACIEAAIFSILGVMIQGVPFSQSNSGTQTLHQHHLQVLQIARSLLLSIQLHLFIFVR